MQLNVTSSCAAFSSKTEKVVNVLQTHPSYSITTRITESSVGVAAAGRVRPQSSSCDQVSLKASTWTSPEFPRGKRALLPEAYSPP